MTPEFFVTYVAGSDPVLNPGHRSWSDVERPSFVGTSASEGSFDCGSEQDLPDVRPGVEGHTERSALSGWHRWRSRVAGFVSRR